MCRNPFINRPATLRKKRLRHSCFPKDFAKCLRTPSLQNTSGRLHLSIAVICQEHLKLNKKRMRATTHLPLQFNGLNLYVTELYTSIHQTASACKQKAKPY